MLVAGFDGRVVGTVSIGGPRHQMPDSLRLFALDVAKEYRKKGIGTSLIRAVEVIAVGRGLGHVNLEVGIGNEGAMRLYKRLGYEVVSGPVEDSWQVLLEDGSTITEREQVWVMMKRLNRS